MRPTVREMIGLLCLLSAPAWARAHRAHSHHSPPHAVFHASAYAKRGVTASGHRTSPGVIAADPRVLPLGSRVRIRGAGRHSGVYTVADTGPDIRGRRIDIFMPSHAEARKFGRRIVKVELLRRARPHRRRARL